jgi:hypothetical protein
MRRWTALVVALLALSTACAQGKSSEGDRSITSRRTRLAWAGRSEFRFTPPRASSVRELRAIGQSYTFDVALGPGYWKRHPGSLHVGIRWTERDGSASRSVTGDLFSLVVINSRDEIVAGITGNQRDISTAQSVDVKAPPDGTYDAVVVPYRVQGRAFEGVVVVRPEPTGKPEPDLAARQPYEFTFQAPGAEGSCLLIEIQEKPGLKRCLRFDARISNVGTGVFLTEADITEAVEQRSAGVKAGLEPEGDAAQVLVGADGKERKVPTGRWVIDKEHEHTHLVDLADYELRRVSADGDGDALVTDSKIGFCPWDLIDERFGKATSTARRYPAYACAVPPTREGDKRIVLKIGISPGWADVYPARRPIQYLDVSDVEDGVYDVVVRVDPNEWYEDANRSNNVATTRIRIAGDTITCVPKPYGCPRRAVAS